ncbi:DUF4421 domain-containing protein [Aureibacter tunicatorum]|uniref:DUF4421 domain-containing protein n=1 Tax=Aureibacter tunicatorum TaxID=866807 RepID=A0AAE3XK53_9BACT|nr:DUF4421 domain-containing protein [Aureibacter tunicatorum]MDR6237479.1 hypothetical protein [Aureibacter tunicatorum]BDD06468.1 hypothetical protein AUTU_39510 [Aureibacter tunicatorum]
MRTFNFFILIILTTIYCLQATDTYSQKLFSNESPVDTTYIIDYTDRITARLYSSIKFTNVYVVDNSLDETLHYKPNDNLNLGFGANYKFIGLNIGLNFPFINNRDHDKYGNTKYLDLQSHLYMRKHVIDFIGQFYRGYYLENSDHAIKNFPKDKYYIRPDIKTTSLGLVYNYVFNHKKYSYRAAFLQNEWQKKSAGSFLLGGNVYNVVTKADSSIVPSNINYVNFIDSVNFNQSYQFGLGVNGGYAHTFVIKSKLFFAISATIGVGFGGVRLHQETEASREDIDVTFTAQLRGGFGYNSEKYYVGVSYVNLLSQNQLGIPEAWLGFSTGNFRVNLVRRFTLNKPITLESVKDLFRKKEQ